MINREGYLKELVEKTGIKIAPGDYRSLQMQFWPELGTYSPDVIIEGDSVLLFVVGRSRHEIDAEKLALLAENGWKLSPRFKLLLITEGHTPPECLQEMKDSLPARRESPLCWLSWTEIYTILHRTLRTRDENATTRELIDALLGLFASEQLAPFVGFDSDNLRSYRESLQSLDRVYTTARLLVSDLESKLVDRGIQRISMHAPDRESIQAKAPRSLAVQYADESWDPGVLSGGGLFMKVDYLVGEIQVGFESATTDPRSRALVVEARQRIADLLAEDSRLRLRLSGGKGNGEPGRDASLLAQLETSEGALQISRVELLYLFDGEREDLLPLLVDCLARLRDFAADMPLLPVNRVAGESPFVVAGS